MATNAEIDDAIQAYLTEQCYGEGKHPDGLMIAAEAGWDMMRARVVDLEKEVAYLRKHMKRAERILEDALMPKESADAPA